MQSTKSNWAVFLALLLWLPLAARGNPPAAESAPTGIPSALNARIDSLSACLDSLQRRLGSRLDSLDQAEAARRLKELLESADRLTQKEKAAEPDVTRKFYSGARTQQGLNPNISMVGDLMAAVSSSNDPRIVEPGDFTDGRNKFLLREVEMGVESALDPYTRGKFFLTWSDQEVGIDEAYLEWLNLPGGVNLKLGKFFNQFGVLNRWHTHALPESDRPLGLVNLFGTENLGGVGISGDVMLPSVLAQANELSLEVSSSPNNISFAPGNYKHLIYCAHFKNYHDLTRNTYAELGLSAVTGLNDSAGRYRSTISAADFTLKWAPLDRQTFRTMEFRNEFFLSHRSQLTGAQDAFGFYSMLRGRLGPRSWLGARLDYSQMPEDHRRHAWAISPHLDIWQSEFVIWRFQYSYTTRNYMDNDSSFIVQIDWAMGPHKHDTY